MYDADEAGPCRFHPGTWVNATSTSRMLPHRKWSLWEVGRERAGLQNSGDPHAVRRHGDEPLEFPRRGRVGVLGDAAAGTGAGGGRARRPAVPTGAPPDAEQFTVGVGDSLNAIALRHRMRKDQIVKWNKLLGG